MNMFNYLRGKITKIQTDSPNKKNKAISAFQQIYLEQMKNYIEAGGGYDVLKQKLFKDINENYMLDSPLVQQIVILLRKALETQQKIKERRSITIIEDLIINSGKVMNQAFNDKHFCQVLANACLYLRKLNNSDRDQLRERACGIFLFWHNKFQAQPNYVFHQFYEKLKRQNAEFPPVSYIKQINTKSQTLPLVTKQQLTNVGLIISQCEELIKNTEKLLRQDKSKLNTQYIRLLKTKTKKILAISTSTQFQIATFQKQKLNVVYKQIRALLKQIEKLNQSSVKQQALQKQKQFLQQKMDVTTPKKSQKQIPKISLQPSPSRSEAKQLKQKQLKLGKQQSNKSNNSYKADQQFVYDADLLDMQVKKPQNPINIANQKIEQKSPVIKEQQLKQIQLRTPPKKQNRQKYEQLIDLQAEDYQSSESEKKINFKDLYSANQLSPEFKGLDLLGSESGQKIKNKQNVKSDEEVQFGDFV